MPHACCPCELLYCNTLLEFLCCSHLNSRVYGGKTRPCQASASPSPHLRHRSMSPSIMEPSQPLDSHQELVKAFLFLRTAFTAVQNMAQILQATDASLANAPLEYYHYAEYKRDDEKAQLDLWQDRLLEAQIGLIHWVARSTLRKSNALPPEILRMIEGYLVDEPSSSSHWRYILQVMKSNSYRPPLRNGALRAR